MRRRKAHEIPGADFVDLPTDLGPAAARQDEQELLVAPVPVVEEALLARRHTRYGKRQASEARNLRQALEIDVGARNPRGAGCGPRAGRLSPGP